MYWPWDGFRPNKIFAGIAKIQETALKQLWQLLPTVNLQKCNELGGKGYISEYFHIVSRISIFSEA